MEWESSSAFEVANELKSLKVKFVNRKSVKFMPVKGRDQASLVEERTICSHASFSFMNVVFTLSSYGKFLSMICRYLNRWHFMFSLNGMLLKVQEFWMWVSEHKCWWTVCCTVRTYVRVKMTERGQTIGLMYSAILTRFTSQPTTFSV
jgi:hypothetical protein